MRKTRAAPPKGKERSSTASTTLKMAVFAPMPSASVSTATAVKPGFFSNCRMANFRSFITQCLHRIDSRRAPGGQPTGNQSYQEDQQRHAANRGRISGPNSVKLAFDDVR